MKKHHFLFLALVLLAHHLHGADETTVLDNGWFRFVALTATNVVFKRASHGGGLFMSGTAMKHHPLEYDEVFAIPLDQEAMFFDRHTQIFYTPLLCANQQKGFRIAILNYNMHGGDDSVVWHTALNDPPVRMDESEVMMILENGKWMNIEDTESLKDKQFRWKAGYNIASFPSDIQDSGKIARLSIDSHYGSLWAEMITRGWVKPNAEVVAALVKAGYLSPDEKYDLVAPTVVSDEITQKNENTLPPSSPPAFRAWLWLLALPVVAGVWFTVRLRRK